MSKHTIIAIDGPAASGKGTLAKRLAAHLGYAHLDTGLLYRLTGLRTLNAGKDPHNVEDAVATAQSLSKTLKPEDLTDPALRTDVAGVAASQVAKFAPVRDTLLQFQKDFAHNGDVKGVVMDGRDIGTVICPDADVKFFVTASVEERANRRLRELQAKNIAVDFDTVLAEMKARDARDSDREAAPLKPAPDAHILDTSTRDADAAFSAALLIIHKIIK